jgi:ABC-2 type transport system permease protein
VNKNASEEAPARRTTHAWLVVAEQELRDLWFAGRGVPLMLAFTVLLGVTTYLVASNQALNFLEQREAVNLTLQIAVAVGSLLVLLGAGDAVSDERERGTLETLLLTPAPRRALVVGKAVAAVSLWVGAFGATIAYVWFVGRGVGVAGVSLASGFLVGSLLALFLAGLGLIVSSLAGSNRLSLSVSLFTLLALYAPTQMPTAAQHGWAGDLLLRIDPLTAGLHYVGKLIVDGHSAGQDVSWLASPLVGAMVAPALALAASGRIALRRGDHA